MDVNKIVCISRDNRTQWCAYAHHWGGIPVFVTRDDTQSRSALYKDGTCFIILGGEHVNSQNPLFVYNRLWHEVAHLYFRDVWKPWDLRYEFRADLVASAATGRDVSLSRLNLVKCDAPDKEAASLLDKRITNLTVARSAYSKQDALRMLRSLRPVTVLSSVRGNQYI